MPPDYVRVILKVFGPSLKRVTFDRCKKINLMDLIPCHQLESLHILGGSSLDEGNENEITRLSPNKLLPKLTSFESCICLGLWTLWLEGKSELTSVILKCCHNGTKVIQYFPFFFVYQVTFYIFVFNRLAST